MTDAVRAVTLAALVLTAGQYPEPAQGPWRAPLAGAVDVVRPFQAPLTAYGPGHRGADLAAPSGAAVLAAGRGQVSFAGRVAGRGVVVLAHAGGLRTTYEPVRAGVRAGDIVEPGAGLGRLEATSHCAGAGCLHWGLRRGTTYLDPMTLVEGGPGAGSVRLLPLEPAVSSGPRPDGCAGRASPWSGSGRRGSRRARRPPRPGPG